MADSINLGVVVGFRVEKTLSFSEYEVQQFAKLTNDYAPIHHDASYARRLGYSGSIVFGHLAVAPFSGMIDRKSVV